ncbi:type IV pilin accessory protein [Acinetobacter sp. ANC 4470]|uniref:TfpX/TfpZ family type IV pilin accessory protein n=1 Tax=Acinetobacter sp. ANC 4470 TaxID=1977881 RepID=UPI000A33FDF4|nr:TfpX/TfpZ family type IV pilin accessory protein [Acinetobacter sp. ANC 4470]OTG68703.1 type IV pilin accessory protein [Acinetobacter sp. ANC 4470]
MKTAKFKFVTAHLIISICVAVVAAGIVFFCWYPFPLNKAVGVTHIFLMMLGIDIVLGPFFTWLVYKEGKKSLKFDLTVIILIQVIALGYGLYQIADGRPAWLVYNVDRFELIKNNEIVMENPEQIQSQFKQVSWFKPQFVAAEFAKDPKQRNKEMFAEIGSGISIAQRPERYVELNKAKKQMQKREQKIELLQQYNNKTDVEKILAKYPQASAFLPMKASAVDMTVLIDQKANVVKIVDLRSWH